MPQPPRLQTGTMRWPRGTSAPWCQARHAGRLDSRSTAARVARPLLNGIQNRAENSVRRVPSTERPRFWARPNGPPPPNRVMLGSAKDRSGRAAIAKAGATDAAAADAHTPRRSWSPVRPHTRLRCRCGLPGRRLVARRGARPAWRMPALPQTPAAVSAPQRGDTDPLSPRRACAHRCCLVWRRRGRVHPCACFLVLPFRHPRGSLCMSANGRPPQPDWEVFCTAGLFDR